MASPRVIATCDIDPHEDQHDPTLFGPSVNLMVEFNLGDHQGALQLLQAAVNEVVDQIHEAGKVTG